MKSAMGSSSRDSECSNVTNAEPSSKYPIEGRLTQDISWSDPIGGTLEKGTIVIKYPIINRLKREGFHWIRKVGTSLVIEVPGECVEWLPPRFHSNDDERDHVL